MEVVLLGTGAADGWPNPWCSCTTCIRAREQGPVRTTTSALVDRTLLVDCGPDAPRQADRAGIGLTGVRAILLTHAHPDHWAPETLLARAWSITGTSAAPSATTTSVTPSVPPSATSGRPRVRVIGPATAIDACRHWIAPDDVSLSLEIVTPGAMITIEGYVVRVLAAAHASPTLARTSQDPLTSDAVLYDVTAPDGARLLYATDTGPLSDATIETTRGAAFDLVLLEETFGRRSDHGTGHHDLTTFPLELARLRANGAIDGRTDVVAVHLGHHNPSGAELDRVLSHWGARTVEDLTVIEVATRAVDEPPRVERPETPCRTLILGGARSGKSREAERRLLAKSDVHYVATAVSLDPAPQGAHATRTDGNAMADPAWAARVAAHRARRPARWRTSETIDVAALLTAAEKGEPVLIDCLALWLAGQLDRAKAWDDAPGTPPYNDAVATVSRAIDILVRAVRTTSAHVVMVSNEVGSGIVPDHPSGRVYRDLLGSLNMRVAAECDVVDLVVAGRVISL